MHSFSFLHSVAEGHQLVIAGNTGFLMLPKDRSYTVPERLLTDRALLPLDNSGDMGHLLLVQIFQSVGTKLAVVLDKRLRNRS